MTPMRLLLLAVALLFAACAATPPPHPVPADPRWLTYDGGEGPGRGKHVVLVAAEQEYRS